MKYLVAIALLVGISTPVYAVDFPAFPMAFWGGVTVNGSVAPVNTVIRAYYGSTLAGQVVVETAGIYGYTEPTKQKLIVGQGSGAITFTIQSSGINGGAETAGTSAQTYLGFTSGQTINKDFSFTVSVPTPTPSSSPSPTPSPSRTPTPTPIPAGGSGGGGSYLPTATATPTPSTTSQKGDANGDGKVDIFDFNSLMIHWGQAGKGVIGDFDGNGVVDIFDFNLLMINWTK